MRIFFKLVRTMFPPFLWNIFLTLVIGIRVISCDVACLPEQQQLINASTTLATSSDKAGGIVLVRMENQLFICQARNGQNGQSGIWCRHDASQTVTYEQMEWRQIASINGAVTGLWVSDVQSTCYLAVITNKGLMVFAAGKDSSNSLVLEPVKSSSGKYSGVDSAAFTPLQYQTSPPAQHLEASLSSDIQIGQAEHVDDQIQLSERKTQLGPNIDKPAIPLTRMLTIPNQAPAQQTGTVPSVISQPVNNIMSNDMDTSSGQQEEPPAPVQIPESRGVVYEEALPVADSTYQTTAIPMILQSTGKHRLLDWLNVMPDKTANVVVSGAKKIKIIRPGVAHKPMMQQSAGMQLPNVPLNGTFQQEYSPELAANLDQTSPLTHGPGITYIDYFQPDQFRLHSNYLEQTPAMSSAPTNQIFPRPTVPDNLDAASYLRPTGIRYTDDGVLSETYMEAINPQVEVKVPVSYRQPLPSHAGPHLQNTNNFFNRGYVSSKDSSDPTSLLIFPSPPGLYGQEKPLVPYNILALHGPGYSSHSVQRLQMDPEDYLNEAAATSPTLSAVDTISRAEETWTFLPIVHGPLLEKRYTNDSVHPAPAPPEGYSDPAWDALTQPALSVLQTAVQATVPPSPPTTGQAYRQEEFTAPPAVTSVPGIHYTNDSVHRNYVPLEDYSDATVLSVPLPPAAFYQRENPTVPPVVPSLSGINGVDVDLTDYSEETDSGRVIYQKAESTTVLDPAIRMHYADGSVSGTDSRTEDYSDLSRSVPFSQALASSQAVDKTSALPGSVVGPVIRYNRDSSIHATDIASESNSKQRDLAALSPTNLSQTPAIFSKAFTLLGIHFLNDSIKRNPSQLEDYSEVEKQLEPIVQAQSIKGKIQATVPSVPDSAAVQYNNNSTRPFQIDSEDYSEQTYSAVSSHSTVPFDPAQYIKKTFQDDQTEWASLRALSLQGLHQIPVVADTLPGHGSAIDADLETPYTSSLTAHQPSLSAYEEDRLLHHFPSKTIHTDSDTDYVDEISQRSFSKPAMSDASVLRRLQQNYLPITADSLVNAGAQYYHNDQKERMSAVTVADIFRFDRPTNTNEGLHMQPGIHYFNDSIEKNPGQVEDHPQVQVSPTSLSITPLTTNPDISVTRNEYKPASDVPTSYMTNADHPTIPLQWEPFSPSNTSFYRNEQPGSISDLNDPKNMGNIKQSIGRTDIQSDDYTDQPSSMPTFRTLTFSHPNALLTVPHGTNTFLIGKRYTSDSVHPAPAPPEGYSDPAWDALTQPALSVLQTAVQATVPPSPPTTGQAYRQEEFTAPPAVTSVPGIHYTNDSVHRNYVPLEDYSDATVLSVPLPPAAFYQRENPTVPPVVPSLSGINGVDVDLTDYSEETDSGRVIYQKAESTTVLDPAIRMHYADGSVSGTDSSQRDHFKEDSSVESVTVLEPLVPVLTWQPQITHSVFKPINNSFNGLDEYDELVKGDKHGAGSSIAEMTTTQAMTALLSDYGDGDYEEVQLSRAGEGHYANQQVKVHNQSVSVNIPAGDLIASHFGYGVHHDDLDPSTMDFSQGFLSNDEVVKRVSNEVSALQNTTITPPLTSHTQSPPVTPLVRGVTGDADYEEVPGAWQYARKVILPMPSPTWILFNGSKPAVMDSSHVQAYTDILSGLPKTDQHVIDQYIPDYTKEDQVLSSQTIAGLHMASTISPVLSRLQLNMLPSDNKDYEDQTQPILSHQSQSSVPQAVSDGMPVPANYTFHDRTLSFEEIYGRPMVIVKKKSTENDYSPRVQVYLDQTADIGEYLLNPIQFPAVIERKNEAWRSSLQTPDPSNHTSVQFPLLGRARSYKSPNWYAIHRDAALDRQLDEDVVESQHVTYHTNHGQTIDDDYHEYSNRFGTAPSPQMIPEAQPAAPDGFPTDQFVFPGLSTQPLYRQEEFAAPHAVAALPGIPYINHSVHRIHSDAEDYSEQTNIPVYSVIKELRDQNEPTASPTEASQVKILRTNNDSVHREHIHSEDYSDQADLQVPSFARIQMNNGLPETTTSSTRMINNLTRIHYTDTAINETVQQSESETSQVSVLLSLPGIHYTNQSIQLDDYLDPPLLSHPQTVPEKPVTSTLEASSHYGDSYLRRSGTLYPDFNSIAVEETRKEASTSGETTTPSIPVSSTGARGLSNPDYDYEETTPDMPTTAPSIPVSSTGVRGLSNPDYDYEETTPDMPTTAPSIPVSSTGVRGLSNPDYDYEETAPDMPTTSLPNPVLFYQPPPVYIQTQPGARAIKIQPAVQAYSAASSLTASSQAPVRGYRWREAPTEIHQSPAQPTGYKNATESISPWPFLSIRQEHQVQQPDVFESRMNRFGQIVPIHQVTVPIVVDKPQEIHAQSKPATRINRFGQEIPLLTSAQASPSTLYLPSQTIPLTENYNGQPERRNRFGQNIAAMGYRTPPVLAEPVQDGRPLFVIRRNRFGQILPTSTSASPKNGYQTSLTRSDTRRATGWLPNRQIMTAPSPPSSIAPNGLHYQPQVSLEFNHGPSVVTLDSTVDISKNINLVPWQIAGEPAPVYQPTVQVQHEILTTPSIPVDPQSNVNTGFGQDGHLDQLKTGSPLASLLVNKTWTESAKSTVENICDPSVTLENLTITEYVDCEESDASEVVLAITARNGSGSYHYEILKESDTLDGSKFSIDESNGLLYPNAVFSRDVDTWESEHLGPDMIYEVKVRVTDDLCDKSDEAFMSIAFRCRKRSGLEN